MEETTQLIYNQLDKLIFIILGGFIIGLYFLWFISNAIKTNNYLLWIAVMPFSFLLAYLFSFNYRFEFQKANFRLSIPYFLFLFLLIGVGLYFMEPLSRYPSSSLGIPFKDMHDGIAAFISDYGYPPTRDTDPNQTAFITNIFFNSRQPYYQNVYLGYPNALHAFSALLIRLGIFEFQATWLAVSLVILLNSLALFLFLKFLYQDSFFAAVIAGLFGISSFRIAYGIVSSIVMSFSISLIIPSLLIFFVAIHNYKNYRSLILPILAMSLIAASFTSAIVLFLGLVILYLLLLLILRKKNESFHCLKILLLFILTIPLFALILFFRKTAYAVDILHPLPVAVDFDPNELSQRILPLDKPLYMLVYSFSLISYLYLLFRKQLFSEKNLLKNFLLLVNLGLLVPIAYDLIFHQITGVHSAESLIRVNPNGLFGGLQHFLMHRLALVQPFFFIFFLGEIFSYFKNRVGAIILLTIIIFSNLILRVELPLYQTVQPELQPSFYNQKDKDKPYTLLSHFRLVTNDQIWLPGIFETLNFLKSSANKNEKILIWDERGWSEESIVNWGSIYLRRKLFSSKDLNKFFLLINNFSYLIVIDPPPQTLTTLEGIRNFREIFKKNSVTLYHLEIVN